MTSRSFVPALIALLALAAPAPAQAEDAEKAFFQAYYLEHGLRDLSAAEAAYGKAAERLAETGRKDLHHKALIARARCLQGLGRTDEARAVLETLLRLAPEHAEAKTLVAELQSPPGDELAARMDKLIQLAASPVPAGVDAMQQIKTLGAAALPHLERALRNRGQPIVWAAAQATVTLDSDESWDVLTRAIADDAVQHPDQVVGAVQGLQPSIRKLDVLAAALRRRTPTFRREVVRALKINAIRYQSPDLRDRFAQLLTELLALRDKDVAYEFYSGWTVPKNAWPVLIADMRRTFEGVEAELQCAAFSLLDDIKRGEVPAKDLPPGFWESARDCARRLFAHRDPRIVVEALSAITMNPAPWDPPAIEAVYDFAVAFILGRIPALPQSRHALPQSGVLELLLGSGPDHLLKPGQYLEICRLLVSPDSTIDEHSTLNLVSLIMKRFREIPSSAPNWRETALKGLATLEKPNVLIPLMAAVNEAGLPARDVMLRLAANENPSVRHEACRYLLREDVTLGPDDIFPRLAEDLRSEWVKMREISMHFAAKIRDPSLVPVLMELVGSKDEATAGAALQALVKMPEDVAVAAARESLKHRPLNLGALRMLWDLLGRRSLEDFVTAGASAPDKSYPLLAAGESSFPPDFVVAYLARIPDSAVGQTLKTAARFVPRETLLKMVERGLDSEEPGGAIRAAASHQLFETIPRLLTLLDSQDEGDRGWAAKALEELRRLRELRGAFEGFTEVERGKALRDAQNLATDADASIRRGAALALGALSDPAAVPALMKMLKDADASVRDAAVKALERLNAPPR